MTLVCSLGSNFLKDEGAGYVAEALKINTTLKELKYAAAHPPHYCQQPLTLWAGVQAVGNARQARQRAVLLEGVSKLDDARHVLAEVGKGIVA